MLLTGKDGIEINTKNYWILLLIKTID